jgi:hypothetical protein
LSQLPEKFIFDASILEFASEQESNDIYMTVKLILLTSEVNLNGLKYSDDFIKEIEENKQKYLSIPLVAEVDKLNRKQYGNLTHKFNSKTQKFETSMIGSFVDFSTDVVDGVLRLIGEVRIPKRFGATVEALQELYASDSLKFSYEILVSDYNVVNGIKYVDKSDKNSIIGMAVVSDPAVPEAKAFMLVAALEKDFNNVDGGVNMSKVRSKEMTCEEFFADSKVVKIGELDLLQVRLKIFSQLENVLGSEWWNFDVMEMGVDYIILLKCDNGGLYRIDYSINSDEVVLSEIYKVSKNYIKIEEVQEKMADLEKLQDNLTAALAEIESLKTEIANKEVTITEKDGIIASKDEELATVNASVVTLSESVITQKQEIETLQASKDELDAINAEKAETEKAEKVVALKEKYSDLLSAETLELPEIDEAIQNLNESVLQAKVTEFALEAIVKKSEEAKVDTAKRVTEDMALETSGVAKYITIE